jgi:hypothetical protein
MSSPRLPSRWIKLRSPAFVVSANDQRRHLSASQRAYAAEKLANLKQGRPSTKAEKGSREPFSSPVSRQQAAEALGSAGFSPMRRI